MLEDRLMDDCWAAVKDHEAFQLTVPPLLEAAMTVDATRRWSWCTAPSRWPSRCGSAG